VSAREAESRNADDLRLLEGVKRGDEEAFRQLVERYSGQLLRVAQMYVSSRAVAEEVVQEAWLGMMRGAERFEGRSSVKTWLFRILANIARTRARKEARSIPFSSAAGPEDADQPLLDPSRFQSAQDPRPNWWSAPPSAWPTPEDSLLEGEALRVILSEIEKLPDSQREVVTLRDVEGWSSEDVRNALEITDTNQRVLLHRGRTKLRAALEAYFGAVRTP
jgi:RNA polymerase sigma-70 factor (ECF subfamily)